MKKLLFSLFTLACVLTGNAMESGDTVRVTTLNDIIAQESKNSTDVAYDQHLRKIWGKTNYFNISYDKTTLSSDELPLGGATLGSNEFKNKFGMGIQWGKTFKLHKKPLGNLLFFGIDFTWMDVNFNQYDKADKITPGYSDDTSFAIKTMPSLRSTPMPLTISASTDISIWAIRAKPSLSRRLVTAPNMHGVMACSRHLVPA